MQIYGATQVHGPQAISSPHRAAASQSTDAGRPAAGVDQLDISPEADLISRLRDVADVRTNRVAQIRAEIKAGTYDTDEKLNVALDRLLQAIG